MPFFKKKKKTEEEEQEEEEEEEPDDWDKDEEKEENKGSMRGRPKRTIPEGSKLEIKSIQRGIEQEEIRKKEEQVKYVPRSIPIEFQLNEILDSQQRMEFLLMDLKRKIDKEIENE